MFRNKSSKTTYGIVGLGRFGQALVQELAESGAELIVWIMTRRRCLK